MHVAPKFTRIAGGSSATNIESGESIVVYGIAVTGDAGGKATFTQVDATAIFELSIVADNESVVWNVPFKADGGFRVATEASVIVTVFHSQGGA